MDAKLRETGDSLPGSRPEKGEENASAVVALDSVVL
jgi:hypothetical protein